ncbi:hypothetical protein ER615_00045 [Streptococcus pyogenes]|nr:hypothetical protein ER615_00045 [Streptococcus pyogenes]
MAIVNFKNTKQIFYNNTSIREVWYNGDKLWQKAQINKILDIASGNNLQISFSNDDINVVLPGARSDVAEYFKEYTRDLLLQIDGDAYNVISANYVAFANIIKFKVDKTNRYKVAHSGNVTVTAR